MRKATAMQERRTRRRIQSHIEALNSPDQDVASRAEINLKRYYGPRTLEQLLEACAHPNPLVRFRAAWELGYTRDSRAFVTLLQLTRDPFGAVRYDAAIALGNLGDERAVEPLIALMCTPDAEVAVESAAAEGLARLGKPAVPALIVLLCHVDFHVRCMAAKALGNIKEDAAIEPLGRLLASSDERTRIDRIEALGIFGAPQCLLLIAGCLEDPSEAVREIAAYWHREVSRTLS